MYKEIFIKPSASYSVDLKHYARDAMILLARTFTGDDTSTIDMNVNPNQDNDSSAVTSPWTFVNENNTSLDTTTTVWWLIKSSQSQDSTRDFKYLKFLRTGDLTFNMYLSTEADELTGDISGVTDVQTFSLIAGSKPHRVIIAATPRMSVMNFSMSQASTFPVVSNYMILERERLTSELADDSLSHTMINSFEEYDNIESLQYYTPFGALRVNVTAEFSTALGQTSNYAQQTTNLDTGVASYYQSELEVRLSASTVQDFIGALIFDVWYITSVFSYANIGKRITKLEDTIPVEYVMLPSYKFPGLMIRHE